MNIHKLKIDGVKLLKMNKQQLEHVLQLVDIEIAHYKKASRNYDAEKHERFSVPHLKGWNDLRDKILKEIG
ncbi:MAG: hypothetical protein DRH57_04805 [Candidatus Cloacimonadota bacterium]|nr:MAG: hypothetical protein DRH57_04805 [Candidatus Cloacimonadota bacterium]